jgi:hypothetical protein
MTGDLSAFGTGRQSAKIGGTSRLAGFRYAGEARRYIPLIAN